MWHDGPDMRNISLTMNTLNDCEQGTDGAWQQLAAASEGIGKTSNLTRWLLHSGAEDTYHLQYPVHPKTKSPSH